MADRERDERDDVISSAFVHLFSRGSCYVVARTRDQAILAYYRARSTVSDCGPDLYDTPRLSAIEARVDWLDGYRKVRRGGLWGSSLAFVAFEDRSRLDPGVKKFLLPGGYDWLGMPRDPRREALRRMTIEECSGCGPGGVFVRYCPVHGLGGEAPR